MSNFIPLDPRCKYLFVITPDALLTGGECIKVEQIVGNRLNSLGVRDFAVLVMPNHVTLTVIEQGEDEA
jgi:hypothetical protein